MSTHASAAALEAFALGESVEATRLHVEACAECAAYVASFKDGAAAFAKRADVDAFLDAVERAAAAPPARVWSFADVAKQRLLWAAAPLAAAAALLLFFRPQAPHAPEASDLGGATAAGESSFKGGLAVAVVRERRGRQERFVGDVSVAPFDRIRIEIALDGARPLAAGALGDDGTWVPLVAPAAFDGGTFFSEHALRFDDAPTAATIVVGAPDAVAAVQNARSLSAAPRGALKLISLRPQQAPPP